MTITVLMPVKGKAPFLEQSLQSIFKSTLKPIEILLIDDGIEPKTVEVIKEYRDLHNVILIQNTGRGIVDALNAGIYKSTGKYIARLDSDDLMHEDRLEIQFQTLERDSSLVVLGSQVNFIDSQNKLIGKSNYPTGCLNNNVNFTSRCLIAHPSATIRKSTLLKIGGYRDVVKIGDTSLCEDFDLWRRISILGNLSNLEHSLTFYRQHDLQISNINSLPNDVATQIVASGYSDSYNRYVYIDPISKKINKEELNRILSFQNLPRKLLFIIKYNLMIGRENSILNRLLLFTGKNLLRIVNRILR